MEKLKEEIEITLFMYTFIKKIVREFNLTPEQEDICHKVAQEDIWKLYMEK